MVPSVYQAEKRWDEVESEIERVRRTQKILTLAKPAFLRSVKPSPGAVAAAADRVNQLAIELAAARWASKMEMANAQA